jgi:hypothetical protein
MNLPHESHTVDNSTESGKALTVRVSFAPEVQFRLVANANEKAVLGGVRSVTGHADCAIQVMQARITSPFETNGRIKLIRSVRASLGL